VANRGIGENDGTQGAKLFTEFEVVSVNRSGMRAQPISVCVNSGGRMNEVRSDGEG
jgi:hypothetical protein